MKRGCNTFKKSGKRAVRGGIISLGAALMLNACSEKEMASGNLNVLFIAVDDLRPEMRCYGNQQIITPNIDRLAGQGVLFERAYCQQAICMASRASLFSGYHAGARQIYSCLSLKELMPEVVTINKFFSNAGYDVFGIGKLYHHGVDHREQFGSTWSDNRTWEGDKTKGRGYLTEEAIRDLTDDGRGPAWEMAEVDDNSYLDGFYAEKVVEKLNDLKNSEKPFFVGVGFQKPHLPFNAPKRYWDLYNPEQFKAADNPYYPENGSVYGIHNFSELRNYTNIPRGDASLPEETEKMLVHGYYACISYVDEQIGKILAALKQNGFDKNTVVILWGDHGWKLGEHGMWCKHTNFEIDTRVPLIISAPGMRQNVKTNSFAEFIDLYPTLADICGLETPEGLHGASLVPILKDPRNKVKDHAYSIWPSYKTPRTDAEKVIIGFSVRTARFRYTEWIHNYSGEVMDAELYDHTSDPSENKNIINDEKYLTELPPLRKLIYEYRKSYCMDDKSELIVL